MLASAASMHMIRVAGKSSLPTVTLPYYSGANPTDGGEDYPSVVPTSPEAVTPLQRAASVPGYPAVGTTAAAVQLPPGSDTDSYPRIVHRRHVIVIAEESFRVDHAANATSPHTLRYLSSQPRCFRSEVHYAGCHVSELAYFGLLYGVQPMHYHAFASGHVPSYPLQVLRHNGYQTAIIAASLLWSFPNANVVDNVHVVDEAPDSLNEQVLTRTRAYLEQWRASKDTSVYGTCP